MVHLHRVVGYRRCVVDINHSEIGAVDSIGCCNAGTGPGNGEMIAASALMAPILGWNETEQKRHVDDYRAVVASSRAYKG